MKILFASNAPWTPSGYGVQSNLLVNYLKKYIQQIVFLTNFGLAGGSFEKDGITYLPDDFGNWCNTSIRFHLESQRPDIIISLADWFVFNHEEWNSIGAPWLNWTPIDLNINKKFDRLQRYLDNCPGVVAMSNFGFDELKKFGKKPLSMIYHALDPNAFKINDKQRARKVMGFNEDNIFLIGMNMANKDAAENRKAFGSQFEAVKKFINQHKDLNVYLFLNTEPSPRFGGIDLIELLKNNRFDLNKVIFTNPAKLLNNPYTSEEMALWYNSLDVLLNASSGEGFGVPIIEAQACGVPVISHEATAMKELTFYGYSVKSDKKKKIKVEQYGYRYLPSVGDIVNGLNFILENRNEELSKEVSEQIRNNFSIDKIGLQWLELIKGIRG